METIITGEKLQFLCDMFIGTKEDFTYNPQITKLSERFMFIDNDATQIDNKFKIFCYTHCLDKFDILYNYLRRFRNQFILLFHNSDGEFNSTHLKLFDIKNLTHIFTQNMNVTHKNVSPVPIGIANSMWPHGNINTLLNTMALDIKKTKNVYFNFNIGTNREKRLKCYNAIKDFVTPQPTLNYDKYLQLLAMHKYAICPEGNGLDTHRMWECLYLKVIPICIRNRLVEYYSTYIPMIILDDWNNFDIKKLEYESSWCNYTNVLDIHNIVLNKQNRIVFVMLRNFQSYIIDNIKNLLLFHNKNITVICDTIFFDKFDEFSDIELIDVMDVYPNYINETHMYGNSFRNGFWQLCLLRFDVICGYMKKYNITNVLHLENDVMLYCNIDLMFNDANKILLTIDAINRCIPGLMFIPNHELLKEAISNFNRSVNDMINWYNIFIKTSLCDTLPIMVNDNSTRINSIITKNYDKYQMIFDGAAIGQYLGGIDPRNISENKDTSGFINETCVFKYNKFHITWLLINGLKIPHVKINDSYVRIANLHIHSKNLVKFLAM